MLTIVTDEKGTYVLIFISPEVSVQNESIGIITKIGTHLCFDDTNNLDLDFSRSSRLLYTIQQKIIQAVTFFSVD